MTTKKIVDAQRKVVEFAKQWGMDAIKIKPIPNDDGFVFMSAQSGYIYYTIPDKGILINTKIFRSDLYWSDTPMAFEEFD